MSLDSYFLIERKKMSNPFRFSSTLPEPTDAMIREAKNDYALRLYHYTQLQLKRTKSRQPHHHSHQQPQFKNQKNNKYNNNFSSNDLSTIQCEQSQRQRK